MQFQRLYNQEQTYSILQEQLKNPSHLFITGPAGSGKTTIVEDFLSMFYSYNALTQRKTPESILVLSSEKDRGIHTIREKVNDFCKRSPEYKGQLRWILFDDADSLPLISQQALRRPMETYAHLTRFIFISRSISNLIAPLRSRCLTIELEPVTLFDLYNPLFLRYGLDEKDLGIVAPLKNWFLMQYPAVHKAIPFIKIVIAEIKDGKSTEHIQTLLQQFIFTSEPLAIDFIKHLVKHDMEGCVRCLSNFFYEGFLLDDVLLALERSLILFTNFKGERRFLLLKFIMRGWISIQQGKEYWLDTIDILHDVIPRNQTVGEGV